MYVNIAVLCLLAFASVPQISAQRSLVDGSEAKLERIISGSDAKKIQFPWQISFQRGTTYQHNHTCGGSILNSRWVLTAAHCINFKPGEDFFVVAGINNLKAYGHVHKVKRAIVHPGYITIGTDEDNKSPNDIALLELDDELEFGPNVGPVELPEKDAIPTGNSTLSGWGKISMIPDIRPVKLQTVDLPLLSYKECENALEPFTYPSFYLAECNICTGQNEQGEGACHGDSGGPLCTKGGNTQIGIVSWIPMGYCGFKDAPTVYTKVSAYIDWINEHINCDCDVK